MSGDKIRCAIETANLVVDQLQPIDKLGIVLYDVNVRTLLSLQFVNDKDFIHRLINSIRIGDFTNLYEGLEEGINQNQLKKEKKINKKIDNFR